MATQYVHRINVDCKRDDDNDKTKDDENDDDEEDDDDDVDDDEDKGDEKEDEDKTGHRHVMFEALVPVPQLEEMIIGRPSYLETG